MADAPDAKPTGKSMEVSEDAGRRRSGALGWIIGWLLVPGIVIGGLFGAGVHVGARHPDMLLTRAVLWGTGAEASRPPATPEEAAPLSRQLYLIALPTRELAMEGEIDAEELAALAGEDQAKDLDCEALCARMWVAKHPDKEFVETTSCAFADEKTKLGDLSCELVVER